MKSTIYIGADHAGFDLKEIIKEHLVLAGYNLEDMGAFELDPVDDYPEYAAAVAQKVIEQAGSFGILACGNAEGVCIAANKFAGIRAGVGFSEEAARTMRSDDNANILCLPGRLQTKDDLLGIVAAFLATPFSGASRHIRRLLKLAAFENNPLLSSLNQGRNRANHQKPLSVVPAILVNSAEAFREKINNTRLRRLTSFFQIDVLDGTFTDQTNFADPEIISKMTCLPAFELHFMVQDPLPQIERFIKLIPNVKRIIVHAEIQTDLKKLIISIKSIAPLEIGLALNPETPATALAELSSIIDIVLVMGVHPGESGQTFLGGGIIKKIKKIRKEYSHLKIGIDGGVNMQNAKSLAQAGADELCVGSAIWDTPSPADSYQSFQHMLNEQ